MRLATTKLKLNVPETNYKRYTDGAQEMLGDSSKDADIFKLYIRTMLAGSLSDLYTILEEFCAKVGESAEIQKEVIENKTEENLIPYALELGDCSYNLLHNQVKAFNDDHNMNISEEHAAIIGIDVALASVPTEVMVNIINSLLVTSDEERVN